jgi:hypothetical protein
MSVGICTPDSEEMKTAEALVAHARPVMAGEAHGREHVGGEQPLPVGVGNLEGVLDLVNAGIVDQDIDLAGGLDHRGDAVGRGHITRRRNKPRLRHSLPDRCDRPLDVRRLAAVDRHLGAVARENFGNGAADAFGGAGDQRAQSGQIDLHEQNS